MTSIAKHTVRRTLVAAGTLAATAAVLPCTAAVDEVAAGVGTRSPEAIARDVGRAGSDTYWISQPVSPMPEPLVKAYDKTKEVVVKGYDKTKEVLTTPPTSTGPERHGRAGGYVGLEKFQMPSGQSDVADARGAPYGRAGGPSWPKETDATVRTGMAETQR